MTSTTVFLMSRVTPDAVVAAYEALGVVLPGRVAVKVHSGEAGNQNFIRPDFVKPVVALVGGVIVETNTAYPGKRRTTRSHQRTAALHGWPDIAEVDILDADGELELPIPGGRRIHRNFVGSHLAHYDSLLVLSHFKGHPMGGFGGAVKNSAIGLASSHGKAYIHGAGRPLLLWTTAQDKFLDSLADASKSIVDHFGTGRIAFVNIMKDMSVDCDCASKAKAPAMGDVGVLASLDPVALDQACVDLVYGSDDPGRLALISRIEAKNGVRTLESAAALGVGSRRYELVRIGG